MSVLCNKPTPAGPCQRPVATAGKDCGVNHASAAGVPSAATHVPSGPPVAAASSMLAPSDANELTSPLARHRAAMAASTRDDYGRSAATQLSDDDLTEAITELEAEISQGNYGRSGQHDLKVLKDEDDWRADHPRYAVRADVDYASIPRPWSQPAPN